VLGDGVQLPRGVCLLEGDTQPMHVKASPNTIKGAYGILAGDPGRIAKIAALFDDPHEVSSYRGFAVFRGTLDGVPVFAAAHGIGSASAAIVIEELAMLGCHTRERGRPVRRGLPLRPTAPRFRRDLARRDASFSPRCAASCPSQ